MAGSDRAFRALAHAEPDVVATLRVLCPALLVEGASVSPEDLEPTKLDALASAREADWAARWLAGARPSGKSATASPRRPASFVASAVPWHARRRPDPLALPALSP